MEPPSASELKAGLEMFLGVFEEGVMLCAGWDSEGRAVVQPLASKIIEFNSDSCNVSGATVCPVKLHQN